MLLIVTLLNPAGTSPVPVTIVRGVSISSSVGDSQLIWSQVGTSANTSSHTEYAGSVLAIIFATVYVSIFQAESV